MTKKKYDMAASLYVGGEKIDIAYDFCFPNVGFSVDSETNRITFDRKITRIVVVDGGGIETIKRRLLFTSIEVGVPSASPQPSEATRIRFRTINGKNATIFGLKA